MITFMFYKKISCFRLGQFIVSTLPSMSASEKQVVVNGISPTEDAGQCLGPLHV